MLLFELSLRPHENSVPPETVFLASIRFHPHENSVFPDGRIGLSPVKPDSPRGRLYAAIRQSGGWDCMIFENPVIHQEIPTVLVYTISQ